MFGMVTEETCFHDTFDAIIGLAYPEFAEPGVTPFFDSLMDSGILGKKVFAFHMSMNPDEEESELTIGYFDENRYVPGTLKWFPVVHPVFWALQLDDIKIGEKSLGLCGPDSKLGKNNCYAAPDSGMSLLTMPSWAT